MLAVACFLAQVQLTLCGFGFLGDESEDGAGTFRMTAAMASVFVSAYGCFYTCPEAQCTKKAHAK